MKTRIATVLSVIVLLLSIFPLIIHAQNSTEKFDKEYEFNDESKTETVYIDVKKSSSTMLMNFVGSVEKGTLKLDIFNPEGEKYPGFHLVSDGTSGSGNNVEISTGTNTTTVTSTSSDGSTATVSTNSSSSVTSSSGISSGSGKSSGGNSYAYTSSTNDKGAKGVVNKVLTDPMPGKWKLVITAKKVTGELTIDIDQY